MSFYKKNRGALSTAIGLAARMARKRYHPYSRGYGRRSTGRSVRARYAAARSYITRTRRKKRMTTGRGITRDTDRRLIYRKSYMPKWKRRRWARFSKKVRAVASIGQGTQTMIHKPDIVSYAIQTIGAQTSTTFALYGNRSTLRKLDHLHMLGNMGNTGNPTSSEGVTYYNSTTVQLRSAIADFTFTNRSTQNVGIGGLATDPLVDFCPLEVDLYEMTMSKKATYLDGGIVREIGTITDLLNFGTRRLIDNEVPYGALTAAATTTFARGLTPWDFTENLSQYGIKITKKTKFFLKNGEYFTYQMRDPRNHMINRSRLEEVPGVNYPGMTKFLYVLAKPVAGVNTLGTGVGDTSARLFVGETYKYTFKVEGQTEDRILVVTDV